MAHGKKSWSTTRKEPKNSKNKFNNMALDEAGEAEIEKIKPRKKKNKKKVVETVVVKARDLDEKVEEEVLENWDDEV
jgi:hypothetical protein